MVLCTDTKTFVIKEAEVSNTMLLVVPHKAAAGGVGDENSMEVDAERDVLLITDSFSSYLEPSVSTPRLEKLQFLLNKARYRGPEHDIDKANLVSNSTSFCPSLCLTPSSSSSSSSSFFLLPLLSLVKLCGWSALQSVVQASDAELLQGLKDLDAVVINSTVFLPTPVRTLVEQIFIVVIR